MSSRDRPARPPRKPYRKPVIQVYGHIRAITQAVGKTGTADGGKGSMTMTQP